MMQTRKVDHSKFTDTNPKIDVYFKDSDDELLAVTVQTANIDKSKYEKYAHEKRWPAMSQENMPANLYFGFLAWSALRREPGCPAELNKETPEAFLETVYDVQPAQEDDDDSVEHPTDADPGSALD